MKNFPNRGDIYWISLDPTVGTETQKMRPCIIVSNNAQNKKSSRVIMAPVTSNTRSIYPFEAKVVINGKVGKAMLDQLRAVDKARLGAYLASLDVEEMIQVDKVLKIALALD